MNGCGDGDGDQQISQSVWKYVFLVNFFFENEFTDTKYEISFEQYLVYNQLCQLSQHMSQKNINKQTQMASQIVKSDQEGGKYL